MTREEHLLAIVAEEGVEVAQRATKALRFTLCEVQPGDTRTNLRRLLEEFADLTAVMEMVLPSEQWPSDLPLLVEAKKVKVEAFLEYSRTLGTLEDRQ